jgi:hypothetical protein
MGNCSVADSAAAAAVAVAVRAALLPRNNL